MRKLIVTLITLTLAATALAGCLGADDDTAKDDPGVQRAQVTQETGGIEGVVVDNAVSPVAGANITVQETGETVTTAEDGSFALSNLPPGQYTLVATAPGFRSQQTAAAVAAGEVAKVEFTLTRVAVQQPYIDKLEFAGFQECATLVGWDTNNTTGDLPVFPEYFFLGYSWCSTPNSLGGDNTTNDRFNFVWSTVEGVETIVLELTWQANSQLAEKQSITIEQLGFENNWDVALADANGESPIIVRRTADDILRSDQRFEERCEAAEEEGESSPSCGVNYTATGGDYNSRLFPWYDCLHDQAGFCNNVQQSFTLYVSVFYHEPAPTDYSIVLNRGV